MIKRSKSEKRPLVFLSHSSTTQDRVELLLKYLEDNGFDTWYSKENIKGGKKFNRVIPPNIRKSDAFIILFCKAADASENVETELTIAKESHKPIFPIGIDKSVPKNLEYFLKSPQWINWLEETDNEPLKKLTEALKDELFKQDEGTDSVTEEETDNAGENDSSTSDVTEIPTPVARLKDKFKNLLVRFTRKQKIATASCAMFLAVILRIWFWRYG